MADAITLDILIDPNGEARRVLEELRADFQIAGNSAEEAAKKAEKFEKALVEKDAKRRASEQLKELAGAQDQAAEATKRHATQNQQLAATIAQYVGPTVIVAAAMKTLRWADSIAELSERTGFSVTAIQQLSKVADASGSSFQAVAQAVQALDQRLVSHNSKAEAVIRGMGLATEDLLKMNPEDRLRKIAEGLSAMTDQAQRNSAENALFGRSGDALAVTLNEIAKGADKTKSALGADFIRAGSQASDMLDELIGKTKDLARGFILLPGVIQQKIGEIARDSEFGRTMAAIRTLMGFEGTGAPVLPSITPKTNAPLAAGGDPFAPGGVGGQSLAFVEQELTAAVKDNIKARKQSTRAAEDLALAEFEASALNQQLRANEWASTARGGMFGGMWGQNIPGVGPGSFPGWAPGNLPSRNLFDLANPGLWNGTGGGMLRAPVESALGGGASGGNWFTNLFKGKAGNLAGGLLGMLPGLIPGLSGRGSSIGGSAGSLIGSLVGGPLAPILGPIGGFLGGAIGKLFGKGEGAKVNDLRDDFVSSAGGIHELNKQAQAAGLTLDRLLKARKVKDFEAAVKELTGAIEEQGRKTLEAEQKAAQAKQLRIVGMNTAAGGLGQSVGALDGLAERGDLSPEQMARRVQQLGQTASTVFLGIVQETGNWQAALDAVGPSLDGLAEHYQRLGLKAEGTTAFLLEFRNTIKNNQDVAASVQGVAMQLDGLGKSGRLTQESFAQFGTTAVEDYNLLIERGTAADQALALMQPTIQKLYEAQQDLGLEVDEGTQSLIDMGRNQGIVGDGFRTESDKMVRAIENVALKIEDLARVLEQTLPRAAQNAADGVNAALGTIDTPEIDPGAGNPGGDNSDAVQVSTGGLIQGRGRVLRFATGGRVPYFEPFGTDTVPAMLTPGEVVLSRDMVQDLGPVMPSLIDGSLADIIRGGGGLTDTKGPDAPTLRNVPRLDENSPRTQPVPSPERSEPRTIVREELVFAPVFIDGRASDREVVDEVFRQFPRRITTGQPRAALIKVLQARRAS
jgi:hypothetical protein